jgi:hypothetical protein
MLSFCDRHAPHRLRALKSVVRFPDAYYGNEDFR